MTENNRRLTEPLNPERTTIRVVNYMQDPNKDQVHAYLCDWVTGNADEAHRHVADHESGEGTTLIARINGEVAGIVTIRWVSENPEFARLNIPLLHQISTAEQYRRQGIASLLMDAAEQTAAERGHDTLGITVGVFSEYGPAQRMYAARGYLPDGRGVCQDNRPLQNGETVVVDHDLLIWLTKALV